MTSFFSSLWNSIFQPGASPQLILATHVSFIALLLTLSWLIYVTKGNIHFIALFIIAVLLWLSVIWFIQELKNVRLMTNEELKKQNNQDNTNTNTNIEKMQEGSDSKSKKDEQANVDKSTNDDNSVVYTSGISTTDSKSRKV